MEREREDDLVQTERLTYEEEHKAIRQLNKRKAVGGNRITAELMEDGEVESQEKIFGIITKIQKEDKMLKNESQA
ncbi:hypothetical protein JTB14_003319 [Gonioctena quinquepunctata]|nr:hypothetical protein JTB14_003319 [Gonioctena quinquepunctata]